MGRIEPELYDFDPEHPWLAIDQMASLLNDDPGDRPGWINFEPDVSEENVPPEPGAFSFFGGRGPGIPFCTFTPTGGTGPMSIGVQHGTGPKARQRLADLGLTTLAGWNVRSDHPKRGLVIEVPRDQPLPALLDWLLAAGEALSAVPVTGLWHMAVYRP